MNVWLVGMFLLSPPCVIKSVISVGKSRFVSDSFRSATVDARSPAPVDKLFIPLFTRCYTSQVVQDFFHQHSINSIIIYTNCLHISNIHFYMLSNPLANEETSYPTGYQRIFKNIETIFVNTWETCTFSQLVCSTHHWKKSKVLFKDSLNLTLLNVTFNSGTLMVNINWSWSPSSSSSSSSPKSQKHIGQLRATTWWFFTNPFEKICDSQIGNHFPKVRCVKIKDI